MSFSVCATGDSLFCAGFPEEYSAIRASLDAFLSGCDLKITNLETNLCGFGPFANQYSGGTWLSVREELFPDLESFGFNFFGTANNHCMDYSYAGMLSTVDFLDRRGYAHAGTGRSLGEAERPAVIRMRDGSTAAVFAVDASSEPPSMAGRGSAIFAPRPGVNYLRRSNLFTVSEKDLEELRRIAARSSVNFLRDGEIASGYLPPDPDGVFVFGGTAFTSHTDLPASRCDASDLSRITRSVRRAKAERSAVFVLVHCHDEEGTCASDPPAYLTEFCRAAIGAGADAVFGGGVHELRGLEIYRGKPVFYSLGDFIYQGMRVEYLPPDFMEKYGLDVNATAAEGLAARSKGGRIGLQTNEKNFLTVVPKLTFAEGRLSEIEILPVKLGFKTGKEALDGLPLAAEGDEGRKIYEKFRALSEKLGTRLKYEDGIVRIGG
ncbi:MAG: CapA family protein [Clostridia bacterium]|nr:CapA family protein [Clostridia bacterium]